MYEQHPKANSLDVWEDTWKSILRPNGWLSFQTVVCSCPQVTDELNDDVWSPLNALADRVFVVQVSCELSVWPVNFQERWHHE